MLDQLLGGAISCEANAASHERLGAALEEPIRQAIAVARARPEACDVEEVSRGAVEIGASSGNANVIGDSIGDVYDPTG